MKKQVCIYNPEILVEMAQEYLNAENDARIFYRQHRPFPGAMLDLRTVEDRARYERHDKESSCTWNAFVSACRLVNADPDTVMASWIGPPTTIGGTARPTGPCCCCRSP